MKIFEFIIEIQFVIESGSADSVSLLEEEKEEKEEKEKKKKKDKKAGLTCLVGKWTFLSILSLHKRLRKENRLSWIVKMSGRRHSDICLVASRCSLHLIDRLHFNFIDR